MMAISIVEKKEGSLDRIGRLLKSFLSASNRDFCITEHVFVPDETIDYGEYVFFDTEIPEVERLVEKITEQFKKTHTVLVGKRCDDKNINLAIWGFRLDIAAFILQVYDDEEILSIYARIFKERKIPNAG